MKPMRDRFYYEEEGKRVYVDIWDLGCFDAEDTKILIERGWLDNFFRWFRR